VSQSVVRFELGRGAFAVNAYLVTTDLGHVLVDTGMRSHRKLIAEKLAAAGVTPASLRLILITHGDMDHIGSAAHFSRTYDAPIAMNVGDVGMTRDGDMFSGRSSGSSAFRWIARLALRLRDEDRFVPDVELTEDTDLAGYGLANVRVLQLAGHSTGSVALLFDDGSLICGDLLEDRGTPKLGSIMDDVPAAERSVERLRELEPATVYPGHGVPFEFLELEQAASRSGA